MVDRVRAWHPEVPFLRETYHADLDHAYPVHTHDDWAVMRHFRRVLGVTPAAFAGSGRGMP